MSKVKEQLIGLFIFSLSVSVIASFIITALFGGAAIYVDYLALESRLSMESCLPHIVPIFFGCFITLLLSLIVAYGYSIYEYNKNKEVWDKVHKVKVTRGEDFDIVYLLLPDIQKEVKMFEKMGLRVRR